jgi:antitoxin component YwqK of YwqJK toxin-antitoxin module
MRALVLSVCILLLSIASCKSEATSNLKKEQDSSVQDQKIKDGPYLEYHESGEIKIVGEYKNGRRSGLWSSWYTNGELQSELNYSDGLENGEYKVFYQNGNLKIKGFYKNGKESTEWLFFDSDGKITARKNYDA